MCSGVYPQAWVPHHLTLYANGLLQCCGKVGGKAAWEVRHSALPMSPPHTLTPHPPSVLSPIDAPWPLAAGVCHARDHTRVRRGLAASRPGSPRLR